MAAIRLLLFTGCRKGDVDEVGSGPDTKNGPSRTVHLNVRHRRCSWNCRAKGAGGEDRGERVCPHASGRGRGTSTVCGNPSRMTCQRAGVEDFLIHDLRHTFASRS